MKSDWMPCSTQGLSGGHHIDDFPQNHHADDSDRLYDPEDPGAQDSENLQYML